MEIKETKKKKRISIVQILIFILAGSVFAFSAYKLFSYFNENEKSEDSIEDLIDMAVTVYDTPAKSTGSSLPDSSVSGVSTDAYTENGEVSSTTSFVPPPPPDPNVIPMSVNFDILRQQNPDIVAWIYCAGTPINYPILQGEDNEYYLERLVNGNHNPNGSIFMDFRNSSDLSDMNTLIYGHNMANSTMFSSLVNYSYEWYYNSHPFLWIITEDQAYRIDVIAGFITQSDSDVYTIFNDEEIFKTFLEDSISQSSISSGISPDSIKNIVTLSTCSNREDSERYVVLCNLVPVD